MNIHQISDKKLLEILQGYMKLYDSKETDQIILLEAMIRCMTHKINQDNDCNLHQ